LRLKNLGYNTPKHGVNMESKEITLKEFADELMVRLEDNKTIDCCKKEIFKLAKIVREKLSDEKIVVDWTNKD
jgi:hypothetical protein